MVLREDAMSGAELCRHICVGRRVSVLEGRSFANFTGTSDRISFNLNRSCSIIVSAKQRRYVKYSLGIVIV